VGSQENEPVHCRPEAFELFAAQVPVIETGEGLLRAAVAMAMHELDRATPAAVEARLQGLADRVRSRVRSTQAEAVLAHAHDVLFEEEGFAGNTEHYYLPINSYLPTVLETRRGLPITLTLIYKNVIERLGVRVQGINAPGHFLAGVQVGPGADSPPMLVDPFSGGQVLSREEAFTRIDQTAGAMVPRSDRLLSPATHRQWLARMLFNLQHVFARNARPNDMAAMLELAGLLQVEE